MSKIPKISKYFFKITISGQCFVFMCDDREEINFFFYVKGMVNDALW